MPTLKLLRTYFLCTVLYATGNSDCAEPDKRVEFFERKIRPILVERCYECHSAKSKSLKGGLRLDHRSGLLAGGDTGPSVVASKPNESLLISAVRYDDDDLQMPPSGKLPDREIALLVRWVELGAPMPDSPPIENAKPEIDFDKARKFWSFQPPRRHPLPAVGEFGWTKRMVDAFVFARLSENDLRPSGIADRHTLVRRVTFDLIGLPPTSDEVHAFLHDDSPDAYERLIDRLLASPRHGERWGRFWLDHARYTDKTASWLKSTGQAYLYRDWVVRAINEDLPYDQFVRQQLAADVLDDAEIEDLPALGFIALSPTYWKEPRLAPEMIKTIVAEEWEERIDALGRTFLGLTLACARCHDHKFDPITQEDYYALAGVFASVRMVDRTLAPVEQIDGIRKRRAKIEEYERQIETLSAMNLEGQKRNEIAALRAKISYLRLTTPHLHAPTANIVEDASLYVLPDGPTKTRLEYRPGARDVELQIRGNPSNPGAVVPRRFLKVLSSGDPRAFQNGSGRLELADAIVGEGTPLAARVIVNRVWAHHFDQPLVATPSNFGTQGSQPTHPKLLDDLTARFIQHDWSLKWLHRELMMSATYRLDSSSISQSAIRNPQLIDPDNRWLWRMNRRRLQIEAWRDSMLAVTDQLQATIGGPSMGLSVKNNRRRTIYGTVHRRDVDRMLSLHDFPDPTSHSPGREPTTTPLQQLFVLNSDFIQRIADSLVDRVQGSSLPRIDEQIRIAYQLLYGRLPTDAEIQLAMEYLEGEKGNVTDDAWQQYCHVLLGSNEFLFVD